jgi:hypothetical protein
MNQSKHKYFLYDLSLPLEQRRQEAERNPFESSMQIARLLAVSPARIIANAHNGNRVYSKSKNKWYAVRQRGDKAPF